MPRPPKRHATSPPSGEKAGKARSTHEDDSDILEIGPLTTSTYQRWNKKGLGLIKKLEEIPEGWDWKDDDIHEELVIFHIGFTLEYPLGYLFFLILQPHLLLHLYSQFGRLAANSSTTLQ